MPKWNQSVAGVVGLWLAEMNELTASVSSSKLSPLLSPPSHLCRTFSLCSPFTRLELIAVSVNVSKNLQNRIKQM